MKRFIPLSLVAGAAFMCLSASVGQAAPLTGTESQGVASAHASGIVSKARWRWHRHHHYRHRRCWWHHHRRHCRYWW